MEVIPSRDLNLLYILLDIGFLLILAGALLWCRKYLAALFGLFGGLLYFLVDYGGFYLLLGTREVSGADPFWFLLWLSMSYGFTNFVWIWLWLDRDGHALEWSVLIVAGWLAVALLSQNFGGGFARIVISRGTGSYHGIMALLLFVGYAILCLHNVRCPKEERYPGFWPSGYWCSSPGSSSFSSPASVPAALARCWSIPCSKRIWVSPISF